MKKHAAIIIVAFSCFFGIVNSANSDTNVFLKIEGIEGESIDKRHRNEIDLLNWSWELTNDVVTNAGSGRAGRPDVGPIIVTKYIDKASPFLNLNVLTGTVLRRATLVLESEGERTIPYLKIDMTDVRISKVSHGGMSNDFRFIESVSLEFDRVCYTYTPTRPDGNLDAEIRKCFDISRNRPF